jgi:uncharacterized protein YggT (Ycf19 family)
VSGQSRKANRETLRLLVIGVAVFAIGLITVALLAYAAASWFFGELPH